MPLMKRIPLSVAQIFFLLTAIIFTVSCGVERSPLAVTDDAARTAPDPGQAAAKRIKFIDTDASVDNTISAAYSDDGRTVTGVFGPEGGSLRVVERNSKGRKDDLEVALTVAPGVLDAAVEISMRVNAEDLPALDVAFEPAGFEFSEAVDLRISLGKDLIRKRDIKKITPYHIDAGGTTADVEYHIHRSSHTTTFHLKVPGFSRYGLRAR